MIHSLWGRADETYGECPVLTSMTAAAFVSGLRGNLSDRFIAASAACKHLAVYAGPDDTRTTFDARVSQRDLVGTFLPAYEACAAAGGLGYMCRYGGRRKAVHVRAPADDKTPQTTPSITCPPVLHSFNSINGMPACANHRTMTFYAREQWNFTGYIVSDQNAIAWLNSEHHFRSTPEAAAAGALNAGCDLEDANDNTTSIYPTLEKAIAQVRRTNLRS